MSRHEEEISRSDLWTLSKVFLGISLDFTICFLTVVAILDITKKTTWSGTQVFWGTLENIGIAVAGGLAFFLITKFMIIKPTD